MQRPDAQAPSHAAQLWQVATLTLLAATAALTWLLTSNQVLVWLTLGLSVVWLGYRFPFERGKLAGRLFVHVVACAITVTLLWNLSNQLIPETIPVGPGGPPPWVQDEVPYGDTPFDTEATRPSFGRFFGYGGPPPPARVLFAVIIYAALGSIGQGLAWSVRARERERRALIAEAQLAQARLAALQMQINPHFLFNALNGISTLIHSDAEAAEDMLGDLSELLRRVLDTADQPQIRLARELEFLDAYLAIEQRRFGDRLNVERNFPPETLDALVPTFILQPVVENAIKHGVEVRRARGLIRLEARAINGFLEISVSDSGKGVGATLSTVAGGGIGLTNTKSRLQQSFGDQHRLSIGTGSEGGCTVVLSFPLTCTADDGLAA